MVPCSLAIALSVCLSVRLICDAHICHELFNSLVISVDVEPTPPTCALHLHSPLLSSCVHFSASARHNQITITDVTFDLWFFMPRCMNDGIVRRTKMEKEEWVRHRGERGKRTDKEMMTNSCHVVLDKKLMQCQQNHLPKSISSPPLSSQLFRPAGC